MARISTSKYQTLRTCPRLFYYEHVLYLERVRVGGARDFGKLYHLGLEAWWRHAGAGDVPWADVDAPLMHAMKAIDEGATHADTDKYEHAFAHAMMLAYHVRWHQLEFTRIADGVEVWFEIPLRDPDGKPVPGWTRIGRKDAFVRFADQTRAKIVEHKHTTAEIAAGKPYWAKLAIDLQPSMYVDAAIESGEDVVAVLYDVSRKPKLAPERQTPEEDREMTQGKGCKSCGGSAGGKLGIKQGSGVRELTKEERAAIAGVVDAMQCEACGGSGWKDKPRWKADVVLEDEPAEDFKRRVGDVIAANPELYFKQADVPRKDEQLAEARADVVAATVEIDAYYNRARAVAPMLEHPNARRVFPRNTAACQHQFGRMCDFIEVCSGQIDVFASSLYRKKQKGPPK